MVRPRADPEDRRQALPEIAGADGLPIWVIGIGLGALVLLGGGWMLARRRSAGSTS